MDEVARIGNADPAVRKAAGALVEMADKAAETEKGLTANNAAMAVASGTASAYQKRIVGVADVSKDATNEFDRMAKSMQRQAAAQEAEAAATGKSVGESAKLRGQYLLTEAATQANIKVTGEYAEKLALVSSRLGDAAQNAALARLKSDLNFEGAQLGRNSDDAAIADRLRGVFGNDVTGAISGAIGDLVRFNNEMRELKGVSIESRKAHFATSEPS